MRCWSGPPRHHAPEGRLDDGAEAEAELQAALGGLVPVHPRRTLRPDLGRRRLPPPLRAGPRRGLDHPGPRFSLRNGPSLGSPVGKREVSREGAARRKRAARRARVPAAGGASGALQARGPRRSPDLQYGEEIKNFPFCHSVFRNARPRRGAGRRSSGSRASRIRARFPSSRIIGISYLDFHRSSDPPCTRAAAMVARTAGSRETRCRAPSTSSRARGASAAVRAPRPASNTRRNRGVALACAAGRGPTGRVVSDGAGRTNQPINSPS